MIKRKDGSYSKRGLWDNIRANKGSGKKPTPEMLEQEKKIKNKNKMGGMKKMYGGTKNRTKMQKGGAKPDYLDMDKDGNKTESMKSAVASKKKMQKGGLKTDSELRSADKAKKASLEKTQFGKGMTDKEKLAEDAKKKMRKGGVKSKKKKMGMGGSKMMKYQAGGFLEPPVYDLDA